MVQLNTFLRIVDNSGVSLVQCIKVLGTSDKRVAFVGDIVIVSVKKLLPFSFSYEKKVRHFLKGSVQRALIVFTRTSFKRCNGVYLKFFQNGAVLVDRKGIPGSNRIKSPIPMEICKQFNAVGSISNIIL